MAEQPKFESVGAPPDPPTPFPQREESVPLPLWRYFRVRHAIKGYDAAAKYQAAVEAFQAAGFWKSEDGAVSVGLDPVAAAKAARKAREQAGAKAEA